MGYTHYWYRDKEIDSQVYRSIVDDFKKLLHTFETHCIKLGDARGEGEPIIDYDEVSFNGLRNCGHPKNHNIVIPWPSKTASGVGVSNTAIRGKWFAGVELETRCCNGDCSYESFSFPRVIEPEDWHEPVGEISYYKASGEPVYQDPSCIGKYFYFCKTAYRPYDWAVTAFLVIAKHYLKDRLIVHSDGELHHWQDAMLLCQLELGYGLDFRL